MKKLLLLLFLSITAFAQKSVTNFTVKDTNLIWTREYVKAITPEEFIKGIKISGISSIVNTGNGIDFKLKFDNEPLKEYGYERKKYPAFMGAGGIIEGTIVFSNDAYVVTITKINYISPANNFMPVPAADSVIGDNKIINDKQVNKALNIYDLYFTNLFRY